MKNVIDVLRHLVENSAWPVDDMKQEAHAVLDSMAELDPAGTPPVVHPVPEADQDPATPAEG